ncbi:MAG: SDR family NAD(P)-dependent oxidoreductase [Hyphomicrobiaceae bacterium]
MPVTYDLSGQTAIVTGASKGIGHEIARRLSAAGASVWNFDLAPPKHDPRAAAVDVTRTADVATAVAKVLADSGRIDILVNNAGFTGGTARAEDIDPAVWRRIIEVNLTGTYEVSRLVVPHMRQAGAGRIVNIASLAGKDGSPMLSAYAAAKAGVIGFTKALGKEVATAGIRVNCIAPAAIDTELLQQMDPEAVASMIARSPQGRLGTIAEAAEMVLWLASDACTFNSGAVFDLSGGRATY